MEAGVAQRCGGCDLEPAGCREVRLEGNPEAVTVGPGALQIRPEAMDALRPVALGGEGSVGHADGGVRSPLAEWFRVRAKEGAHLVQG